jgi:hypothetical protein
MFLKVLTVYIKERFLFNRILSIIESALIHFRKYMLQLTRHMSNGGVGGLPGAVLYYSFCLG